MDMMVHDSIKIKYLVFLALISLATSVQAQPANDFPCDAFVLPVRESCTYDLYTNLDATSSGVSYPGCGFYLGGDVWFKLEIPLSGSLDIQTNTEAEDNFPDNDGWLYRGGMAIYSGSCDNLTLLECNVDNGSNHARMPGTLLEGLTPGDSLWIRIWEYGNSDNGMFEICVVDPDLGFCAQIYTVSGGGEYCQGDVSATVQLSGSEAGVHYTLLRNDIIRLDTLEGTGEMLTWSSLSDDGTYKIIAEHLSDACTVMMNGSSHVEIFALPQLSASINHATCSGLNNGSINLSVIALAPYEVEWTGPSGFLSNEEDPDSLVSGTYVVTVTDSIQCVSTSAPLNITEPEKIVISVESISPLSSYDAGDGSVEITISGAVFPYFVYWSGTDNYESTMEDPDSMTVGYYRVMVTDQQECTESMEGIRLVAEEDPDEIFIPESFSPNGDGYNDRFVILGIEHFADNELMVFNRQGVTVFYRANYQNDWDGKPEQGRVLGGELPEGTYYYIFKYGQNGIRKGYVYINRE
jgi:gliding motility-associated-like protein